MKAELANKEKEEELFRRMGECEIILKAQTLS